MNYSLLLLLIPCIAHGAARRSILSDVIHSDTPLLTPYNVAEFLAYKDKPLITVFNQIYGTTMTNDAWYYITLEGRIVAQQKQDEYIEKTSTAPNLSARKDWLDTFHWMLREQIFNHKGYAQSPAERDSETKKGLATTITTLAYAIYMCQSQHPDIFKHLYKNELIKASETEPTQTKRCIIQ